MKEENIKSYTRKQLDAMIARGEDKTDFAALDAMKDEDIDTSEIPELGDWFWDKAVLVQPNRKSQLTLRLDADLLKWLKKTGKGYQTKINAILRSYMMAQVSKSRSPKTRHS
jgi:uncharacterized protein (DUF4415 family)